MSIDVTDTHTPPSRSHPLPAIGTNQDRRSGERGVDIIGGYGGMIYISDADIPLVLSLLARHLYGEDISIIDQISPGQMSDSAELDDAVQATERHIAVFAARLAHLVERRNTLDCYCTSVPLNAVQHVRLEDLIFDTTASDASASATYWLKRMSDETQEGA